MNFKRILAALLAACSLSVTSFAYTPFLPEKAENEPVAEETEDTTSQEEAEKEESNRTQGIVSSFLPKDYRYKIFEQTLDLYVEKHLFDFTKEEVLYKFFEDFLNENPAFFTSFMNYLLGTMDPYSAYHESGSGFLETQSSSVGFGFTVRGDDKGVYIDSVIAGSSADKAGFMPGDRFVSIVGTDVAGHTLDVVSAILAKPQNFMEQAEVEETTVPSDGNAAQESVPAAPTEFEIVIERDSEQLTFNIAKGPMALSQISSTVVDNDGKPTAYVQVLSFLGSNTDREFNEIIKKHASDGIKHLTVDLRDNGGGSLELALSMAESFLDKDELICYYNDKTLEEPKPVYSTTDKTSFDSITILINENTASAAELFASILKDKGLAKIVGTKSYGKSLGQEVYSLVTGDYVTITTYQMLNEKLESYDGIGIIPDLAIEDVEMCYILPELGVFNHQNYTEIKEGVYSDVTKALEDRLNVMGLLKEDYCDGIFDEKTKTAVYVLQKDRKIPASGYVDYATVSQITRIINAYKSQNYYDNTQYDVAMIVHHSFSQGKRLVKEKERLRNEQAELITQRDDALNAAYDAEHFPEEAAKE